MLSFPVTEGNNKNLQFFFIILAFWLYACILLGCLPASLICLPLLPARPDPDSVKQDLPALFMLRGQLKPHPASPRSLLHLLISSYQIFFFLFWNSRDRGLRSSVFRNISSGVKNRLWLPRVGRWCNDRSNFAVCINNICKAAFR